LLRKASLKAQLFLAISTSARTDVNKCDSELYFLFRSYSTPVWGPLSPHSGGLVDEDANRAGLTNGNGWLGSRHHVYPAMPSLAPTTVEKVTQ
jgi:hypothetical protein